MMETMIVMKDKTMDRIRFFIKSSKLPSYRMIRISGRLKLI